MLKIGFFFKENKLFLINIDEYHHQRVVVVWVVEIMLFGEKFFKLRNCKICQENVFGCTLNDTKDETLLACLPRILSRIFLYDSLKDA